MDSGLLGSRGFQSPTLWSASNGPGFYVAIVAFLALLIPTAFLFFDPFPQNMENDVGHLLDRAIDFKNWLSSGDQKFMSTPLGGYPPYLDGVSTLYGITSFATDLFWNADLDPGQRMILHFRLASALVYVVGGICFFFLARLISTSNAVALLLAIVFVLSNEMLDSSFLRMDHFIVAATNVLIFLSLLSAGRNSPMIGAALGMTIAILVQTKISSVMLCIAALPAILENVRRNNWRMLIAVVAAATLLTAALSVRYIFHPRSGAWILWQKFELQALWRTTQGILPLSYYTWEFPITQYGAPFVTITLLAIGVVAFASFYDQGARTIALPLIVLSIFSIFQMKYHRFAMSLLPFILLSVAVVAREILLSRVALSRSSKLAVASILPLMAFPSVLSHAVPQFKSALGRSDSIQITRIQARDWLPSHVRSGSRVGYYLLSDWSLPRILSMDYQFSFKLFKFPYLDRNGLRAFSPPSYDEIEKNLDVIVLTDCFQEFYDQMLTKVGAETRAGEWREFVRELSSRYQKIEFRAKTPNYCVSEVTYYLVNPSALISKPEGEG
jgi:hypothetical protein